MRHDMSKVIVERPRQGHAEPNLHQRGRDRALARDEDLPKFSAHRESHSKGYYGDRKQLNENLNPLRRFLRANVGRPWRKVYSEVREHLRVTNPTQLHVMQHLVGFDGSFGFVCLHVEIGSDGKARPKPPNKYRSEFGQDEFYVHPRTGLLCRGTVPRRAHQERLPSNWVAHDGVWYEVERHEVWRDTQHSLRGPEYAQYPVDALTGQRVRPDPEDKRQRYAARTRRLSSREVERAERLAKVSGS